MVEKKGQGLSFTMIIVASLGVLVLIIVAIIFRESIIEYTKGYRNTANTALDQAEGDTCVKLFDNSRRCSTDTPKTPGKTWQPISGNFRDCEKPKNCYESSPASEGSNPSPQR